MMTFHARANVTRPLWLLGTLACLPMLSGCDSSLNKEYVDNFGKAMAEGTETERMQNEFVLLMSEGPVPLAGAPLQLYPPLNFTPMQGAMEEVEWLKIPFVSEFEARMGADTGSAFGSLLVHASDGDAAALEALKSQIAAAAKKKFPNASGWSEETPNSIKGRSGKWFKLSAEGNDTMFVEELPGEKHKKLPAALRVEFWVQNMGAKNIVLLWRVDKRILDRVDMNKLPAIVAASLAKTG